MTSLRDTASDHPARRDRDVWWGFGLALALVAIAMALPAVTDWNVRVRSFPPLHAFWDPRVGPGTLPALALAVVAVRTAFGLAAALPWPRLLLLAWGTGVIWLTSLALVDGSAGIGTILETDYEYLETARATTDLPATLEQYVSRIPYDAPQGNWPVHIAGHPPGALTFFVVLVRLGLGGGFAAGMVVTLIAATTAVAVLVTLRVLGAEAAARRAAPFLVLGPAALWQSVSADGMFAAVVAWGIALLAVAATRNGAAAVLAALGAGAVLGYAVMLSYGLPLAGVLALAVLAVAGSRRPLLPAVLAALAVVGAYAAFGFNWLEAFPVLRERYWDGVASRRPWEYWIWGNLAAFVCSAGAVVGAGVVLWFRAMRARAKDGGATATGERVIRWLGGAGIAMVLLANGSQMSKAEVERIWLPFVPWVLLTTALLPDRFQRPALAVQVAAALVLQHLLQTGW